MTYKIWIKIFLSLLIIFIINTAAFADQNFEQFVEQLRTEAQTQGISQPTINRYLTGLKAPQKALFYNLHHQAQARLPFSRYQQNMGPPISVQRGREAMKQYSELLQKIQGKFQVQAQYLVAIWGVETNFGRIKSHYPLVASLVTLAYQHHRSSFYRKEVFSALKILDHQKIPEQAYSTWDGGMGQPCFEPSSYLYYGADFDGDGFCNIWTSQADVFASIANYLQLNGWIGGQPWGVEIKLPKDFDLKLTGRDHRHPLLFWKNLGITTLSGNSLPNVNSLAEIILTGDNPDRAFLVFHNFEVLLSWNHTTFEALVIGLLADQIAVN